MRQAIGSLTIRTDGKGLMEITGQVESWLDQQELGEGLLTIFCRHTSASLVIQENAAPAARRDLERYFDRIAPERGDLYEHDDEGPDDMPAHIRSALTATSLSIPVQKSRLMLGRWQGIFLFEHRASSHNRVVALHLLGE